MYKRLDDQLSILATRFKGKPAILLSCGKPTNTLIKGNQYWGVKNYQFDKSGKVFNKINHYSVVNNNGNIISCACHSDRFQPV